MAKKNNKTLLIVVGIIIAFMVLAKGDFTFFGTVGPNAYVERDITLSPNQAYITYSIVGGSDKYGGIIKEKIPTGYTYSDCVARGGCKFTSPDVLEMVFTQTVTPHFTLTIPSNPTANEITGWYYFGEDGPSGLLEGDFELYECADDSDCSAGQTCSGGVCFGLCELLESGGVYTQCQEISGGVCSADDKYYCTAGNVLYAWNTATNQWDYFCYITGDYSPASFTNCPFGCANGECQNQVCLSDSMWCENNILWDCAADGRSKQSSVCPITYSANFNYCYEQAVSVARCCNNMVDADANCMNSVDDGELLNFIGKWIDNQYSNNEMLQVITVWAQDRPS